MKDPYDLTRALRRLQPGETLRDPAVPGLSYRARKGGLFAQYRYKTAKGWKGITLGRVEPYRVVVNDRPSVTIGVKSLTPHRKRALELIEAGGDPRSPDDPSIEYALDLYEVSLRDRGLANAGKIIALLRYRLIGTRRTRRDGRGRVSSGPSARFKPHDPLSSLTRAELLSAFAQPGMPRETRLRTTVFLNWAANEGHIPHNPLAGYRAPRRTRQQMLAARRTGRTLADAELARFWTASAEAEPPFDRYLLFLLLTGQRRTETALMRWAHVEDEVWTIPAELTKAGREHRVPLPGAVRRLLGPAHAPGALVFPGRSARPMTGYSVRLRPIRRATAAEGLADWTLHDLRRTFRSGLTALGVPEVVAELMLNHEPRDELGQAYDRYAYWDERCEAARRWTEHVLRTVRLGMRM